MPALRKGCNNRFLQTIEKTIAAYNMFKPLDSVLVGVSGGPDSVALLSVLHRLSSPYLLKLGVAHLNHGLRSPDSEKEAEFVASLAADFKLPFYTRTVDVRGYRAEKKLSQEEAARILRYDFLNETAMENGYDKIALGHHADDSAEQVLINLFRGSGPLGLSGIPAQRGDMIVRPLIDQTRSDIVAYLNNRGLPYVCDSSNQNLDFLRNRIRHDLIPRLKEAYNPKIVDTLNRLASVLFSENEWMDEAVRPVFDSLVLERQSDRLTLSIAGLTGVHRAVQRRVVRKAIESVKGNLRRVSFNHIDSVTRLLENGPAYGSLDLPDRIRVRRRGDVLLVSREASALRTLEAEKGPDRFPGYEYVVVAPGTVYVEEIRANLRVSQVQVEDLPDFGEAGHRTGFFDMKRVGFPLILRNHRPGDRFVPLGMTGTQKVQKYFINRKVPRPKRAGCPVLVSQGKIIWVVGHRIDDSVKVTPATRNVLKVELFLA